MNEDAPRPTCANCGQAMGAADKFCRVCGLPVARPARPSTPPTLNEPAPRAAMAQPMPPDIEDMARARVAPPPASEPTRARVSPPAPPAASEPPRARVSPPAPPAASEPPRARVSSPAPPADLDADWDLDLPPGPPDTHEMVRALNVQPEPQPFLRQSQLGDTQAAPHLTTGEVVRATSPTQAVRMATSTLVMLIGLMLVLAVAGVILLVLALG